jgi:hypothetical protein
MQCRHALCRRALVIETRPLQLLLRLLDLIPEWRANATVARSGEDTATPSLELDSYSFLP